MIATAPEERLRQLRSACTAGGQPDLLLFWGHRRQERIGPSCLSQWWEDPFLLDGITYPTAEHWMMASKARLFGDAGAERSILAAPGPREAKALGRKVQGFDADIWRRDAYGIVVAGNLAKFAQHAGMCSYLLSTQPAVLVEASPYDGVWGIGLGPSDPKARDPLSWRGENLLGFALMEVRDRLASRPGATRAG